MGRPSGIGGTADVTTVRIVVLGDSGTGKSALVRRLVHQLGGTCSPAPQGTTVGAHIEAVVWPASVTSAASASSKPVVIELIEMGGNRGFTPAARLPFFAQCAAAIIVYSEAQDESRKSLVAWYNELEAARAAAAASTTSPWTSSNTNGGSAAALAPLPFVIVGTQMEPTGGGVSGGPSMPLGGKMHGGGGGSDPESAGMHAPAGGQSFEATVVARVPVAGPVFAAVRQALAVVSGVALLVLSFVLLGRFVVPWAGVSAAKAITHIEARAAAAASSGGAGGLASSPASLQTLVGFRGDDDSQSSLRRVGGRGGDVGGLSGGGGASSGASPYFGHVEAVSLGSDRDFAATGEGLFDFIGEAVRSTSPASSRSSESSHTAAAAATGRRYAP
jgi:hypothetical protein